MSQTIHILIGVELPSWWKDVAIRRYRRFASPTVELIGTSLDPTQQEASNNGDLLSPLVENALDAERRGAQAHILDCFGDPCMEEIGDRVSAPVIGVGQSGMIATSVLHGSFAVLTSELRTGSEIEANASRYGLRDSLVACDAIEIPAAEIPSDPELAYQRLVTKARRLVREDVSAIILGCTELAMMATRLQCQLQSEGASTRIVNPIAVAERWAEMAIVARCVD